MTIQLEPRVVFLNCLFMHMPICDISTVYGIPQQHYYFIEYISCKSAMKCILSKYGKRFASKLFRPVSVLDQVAKVFI